MIKALEMVTPWCMGVRYQNLAHCVEASVGGAGALKKRRIDARPLPCALIACDATEGDVGYVHAVGHNAESAYAWILEHSKEPAPPFDEWKAGASFPETDAPLHMVIEAKHCGKRAFVDLTVGQVREASQGRIKVRNIITHYGDGWPRFDLENGAWLAYGPSPNREKTRAPWRDHDFSGIAGDMNDLMSVALKFDLDHDRFTKEMLLIARTQGYL